MFTKLKKFTSILLVVSFLSTSTTYGLGVAPGSDSPETRGSMYALGQKTFAARIGPGAIDFDNYKPSSFQGEVPQLPGIDFVNADYANLPSGWLENPILQKTDLIEAFEYFRDNEAKISSSNLEIKEGYFEVDEGAGELPIARIEVIKEGGDEKYVLIIHTKFVQMWNHIRENDVWFETGFMDGSTRTVSVAWGLFYRLVKHEMSDLEKSTLHTKNIGHLVSVPGIEKLAAQDNEIIANNISGRYWLLNDAIWMWFLGSYSFSNTTRFRDLTFAERLEWFFNDPEAADLKLNEEFPRLEDHPRQKELAIGIARLINYNFFSQEGTTVPDLTVDEELLKKYESRKPSIDKVLYASGQNKNGSYEEYRNKLSVLKPGDSVKIGRSRYERTDRDQITTYVVEDRGRSITGKHHTFALDDDYNLIVVNAQGDVLGMGPKTEPARAIRDALIRFQAEKENMEDPFESGEEPVSSIAGVGEKELSKTADQFSKFLSNKEELDEHMAKLFGDYIKTNPEVAKHIVWYLILYADVRKDDYNSLFTFCNLNMKDSLDKGKLLDAAFFISTLIRTIDDSPAKNKLKEMLESTVDKAVRAEDYPQALIYKDFITLSREDKIIKRFVGKIKPIIQNALEKNQVNIAGAWASAIVGLIDDANDRALYLDLLAKMLFVKKNKTPDDNLNGYLALGIASGIKTDEDKKIVEQFISIKSVKETLRESVKYSTENSFYSEAARRLYALYLLDKDMDKASLSGIMRQLYSLMVTSGEKHLSYDSVKCAQILNELYAAYTIAEDAAVEDSPKEKIAEKDLGLEGKEQGDVEELRKFAKENTPEQLVKRLRSTGLFDQAGIVRSAIEQNPSKLEKFELLFADMICDYLVDKLGLQQLDTSLFKEVSYGSLENNNFTAERSHKRERYTKDGKSIALLRLGNLFLIDGKVLLNLGGETYGETLRTINGSGLKGLAVLYLDLSDDDTASLGIWTDTIAVAMLNSDLKGKHVVDLGAGFGTLSALSMVLGADSVDIVEITEDKHQDANMQMRYNGFQEETFNIYTGKASDIKNADEVADEIIGNLGEKKEVVIVSNIGYWPDYPATSTDVIKVVEVLQKRKPDLKITLIGGGYANLEWELQGRTPPINRDIRSLQSIGFGTGSLAVARNLHDHITTFIATNTPGAKNPEQVAPKRSLDEESSDDKEDAVETYDKKKIKAFEKAVDTSFRPGSSTAMSLSMIQIKYAQDLPEAVVIKSLKALGFVERNGKWARETDGTSGSPMGGGMHPKALAETARKESAEMLFDYIQTTGLMSQVNIIIDALKEDPSQTDKLYKFLSLLRNLNLSFADLNELDDLYRAISETLKTAVSPLTEDSWITIPELNNLISVNRATGEIRFFTNAASIVGLDLDLWMARHGKTEGNALKVLQGASDVPGLNELNDLGKEQAVSSAEALFESLEDKIRAGKEIVVVTSTLARSKETAQIFVDLVKERTGITLEMAADADADEISFGVAANKPYEKPDEKTQTKLEKYGIDPTPLSDGETRIQKAYLDGNATAKFEEGESFIDVLVKSKRLLQKLNWKYSGKTVVLVGHGTQLNAVRVLLGDDLKIVDDAGGNSVIKWREIELENGGCKQVAKKMWRPVDGLNGKILVNPETGQIKFADSADPVLTPEFELWSLRHGASNGNMQHILQGARNEKPVNYLSEEGVEQAEMGAREIFEQLGEERIKEGNIVYIVSGLVRSRQTGEAFAALVKEKLGIDIRLKEEELANEMSFGEWGNNDRKTFMEGDDSAKIEWHRKWKDEFSAMAKPPVEIGGENFIDVIMRNKALLEKFNAEQKGKTVVVFDHGTCITAKRVLLGDKTLVNKDGIINWQKANFANVELRNLTDPASMEVSPEKAGRILDELFKDTSSWIGKDWTPTMMFERTMKMAGSREVDRIAVRTLFEKMAVENSNGEEYRELAKLINNKEFRVIAPYPEQLYEYLKDHIDEFGVLSYKEFFGSTYHSESFKKHQSLITQAEREASEGNYDKAKELAGQIDLSYSQSKAFYRIALIERIDSLTDAFQTIGMIKNDLLRAHALRDISKDLLAEDKFEEAKTAAAKIDEKTLSIRSLTFRYIVEAYLEKGKHYLNDAFEMSERVEDPQEKALAFSKILKTFATVSRGKGKEYFDNARLHAENIVNSFGRDETLQKITADQKEAGLNDEDQKIKDMLIHHPSVDEENQPLVKTISEYVIQLGVKIGPGAIKELDTTKKTNIWEVVSLLHNTNIEILIPQSIQLTDDVEDAVMRINQIMKKNGKSLVVRRYREDTLLEGLRKEKEGYKRIVVTDQTANDHIDSLLQAVENVEAFKGVRVLNVNIAEFTDNKQKSVYQAKLLMTAILARLLEKGDSHFLDIKALLSDMLKNTFASDNINIGEFIDKMAVIEDQDTSVEEIIKRVKYFISDIRAISLIKKLEIELRAIQEFWTYA